MKNIERKAGFILSFSPTDILNGTAGSRASLPVTFFYGLYCVWLK